MEFAKKIEYIFKNLITSVLRLFFKQDSISPSPPYNRILFLRYGHIGDMILSAPVFRAVRTCYPNVQIDVVCDITNAVPIKGNNLIDKIYYYEKSLIKIARLTQQLRKNNYDYICNLTAYPSLTFGMLARVIGPTAVRAGGDQEQYDFFYNRLIELPPKTQIHMLKRLFLLSADITGDDNANIDTPWITLSESVEKKAIELYMSIVANAEFQIDDPNIVMINLSAGAERREWPEEKYIHFFKTAVNKYKDKIDGWAIITDPEKPSKAHSIVQQLQIPSVVQVPQTKDLLVLMALLKHCYLIITPDTSFIHAASAVGTPVIALMTGEKVTTWAPVGVKHIIVSSDDPLSLKDLSVENVLTGLDELLKDIS